MPEIIIELHGHYYLGYMGLTLGTIYLGTSYVGLPLA